MAITISTQTLNAGFSRADVLTRLETIFADLGYHAPGISGLVTSLQSRTGGGTDSRLANQLYYDVASTTSGSGTGATFDVYRDGAGTIYYTVLNKPGRNYANGDTITIPAANIGTTENGATDVTIVVNASTTTFGSPTTYFAQDLTRNDPWAVMRQECNENKAYGFTYRGFQIDTANQLSLLVGSSFYPFNTNNTSNLGGGPLYSFRGEPGLDLPMPGIVSPVIYDWRGDRRQINASTSTRLWATNSDPLQIITYRSQLDPNFAIIQFRQSTISSQNLVNNTFFTFSLSNYNTALWDLDFVFLGGVNQYVPVTSLAYNQSQIGLQNLYAASSIYYAYGDAYNSRRMAEAGYSRSQYTPFLDNYYSTFTPFAGSGQVSDMRIYSRNSDLDAGAGSGPGRFPSPNANYRAVMKGIPISGKIAPVPYYLPDEFVLIDFRLNTPLENIQPGNTVTVSPSEVYTVITGGYVSDSATSATWGVLLAARTTG